MARRIAANLPALGATRFDLNYRVVGLPHAVMTTIELYGTQVVPRVRVLIADNNARARPVAQMSAACGHLDAVALITTGRQGCERRRRIGGQEVHVCWTAPIFLPP